MSHSYVGGRYTHLTHASEHGIESRVSLESSLSRRSLELDYRRSIYRVPIHTECSRSILVCSVDLMSSVHSPRLGAGALGPVARRHRRARVRTSAGLVQQAWAEASARLSGGGALVVDLEEVKRLLSTRVAGATEAVQGAIAGAETAYSALLPSLQHLGERFLAAGSGPEALAARQELVEMLASATHSPGAPAAASALALAAALAVAASAPRSQPPPSPAEAAAEAMTEEASGVRLASSSSSSP